MSFHNNLLVQEKTVNRLVTNVWPDLYVFFVLFKEAKVLISALCLDVNVASSLRRKNVL